MRRRWCYTRSNIKKLISIYLADNCIDWDECNDGVTNFEDSKKCKYAFVCFYFCLINCWLFEYCNIGPWRFQYSKALESRKELRLFNNVWSYLASASRQASKSFLCQNSLTWDQVFVGYITILKYHQVPWPNTITFK